MEKSHYNEINRREILNGATYMTKEKVFRIKLLKAKEDFMEEYRKTLLHKLTVRIIETLDRILKKKSKEYSCELSFPPHSETTINDNENS